MDFAQLERNDIEAALAIYREAVEDGSVSAELVEMLLMMQDDSTELRQRLAAYRASKEGDNA